MRAADAGHPARGRDEVAAEAAVELSARGIVKQFGDGPKVLDDVGFSVRRGSSTALIGANGAGKSTLLRCCLRLIEPDGGEVDLLGERVTGLNGVKLRQLRARVGFVFQKHNLVLRLSALSNVLHGVQARKSGPGTWFQGIASREDRDYAMHCLEMVKLEDFAGRRADRLSGGQQQRVAIARALMQRPEFMVADEPVASLDPQAGEEVMSMFVELIRCQGLTLLFTCHNLEHALTYADRVIGLRAGRAELDGPTAGRTVGELRGLYG